MCNANLFFKENEVIKVIVSNFIDETLSKIRETHGSLEVVSDEFVLAYGPYMAMRPNTFELECDEISKSNKVMKLIVYAAYLLRKVTNEQPSEIKYTVRNFIGEVDKTFDGKEKECLIDMAKEIIKYRTTENFMTNSSPIIPYSQTVSREKELHGNECTKLVIADKLSDSLHDFGLSEKSIDYVYNMLLDNLKPILLGYKLTTTIKDPKTNQNDFTRLDYLVKNKDRFEYNVCAYYFVSAILFYGLPTQIFKKYLDFFDTMGDFSKTKNYQTFEALVDEMASITNVNISLESLYDEEIDKKADEIFWKTSSIRSAEADVAKYDLNIILNYISLNRFIEFNAYANRLFTSTLDTSSIINVNIMGDNRYFYELDSDMMVCPFEDIRDHKVKLLVLHAYAEKLELYSIGDIT